MKDSKQGTAKAALNDGVVDNSDGDGSVEESKTGAARIGSPEIQAKTDAAIKEAEMASGTKMGEPERQAVHDAIEMSREGQTTA